jgi:hypothetical protein
MRIIPHHFFLEFIVFFFNLFIVCSTFVCPSPGSTLYITLIHREHCGSRRGRNTSNEKRVHLGAAFSTKN